MIRVAVSNRASFEVQSLVHLWDDLDPDSTTHNMKTLCKASAAPGRGELVRTRTIALMVLPKDYNGPKAQRFCNRCREAALQDHNVDIPATVGQLRNH